MKKITPIRIHNLVEFGYNILRIEIMQERYKSDFMASFEPIGVIQFTQSKDTDLIKYNTPNWFGMQFSCTTSYNTNVIDNFNKIVKHINKVCSYDSQPINIIRAINGIGYNSINNEIISVLDEGKYCFDINYYNPNNIETTGIYARIIATNLKEAQRKLNNISKKKSYSNYTFSIGKSFLIESSKTEKV